MEYYEEKIETNKELKSTANITLELNKDNIIYNGVFNLEYISHNNKENVKFIHKLHVDKINGNFSTSCEILNKKYLSDYTLTNSWNKNNNFIKLHKLTETGFFRGEKQKNFWGAKYNKIVSNFFISIKNDLQFEMKRPYLKNKNYSSPSINRLYDLIVDYYLYKKNVKPHDNVYHHIQTVYPKKKWLKLNDNKFLPAVLEEYGIKSKYFIKELSKTNPLSPIKIKSLSYLCGLFGDNYIDYIRKFDWKSITTLDFNRRNKHLFRNEHEKKIMISVFNQHINLKEKKKNVLSSVYSFMENRRFLEEHKNGEIKLKIKSLDDLDFISPCWLIIKKQYQSGYIIKYNFQDDFINDIQTPIILDKRIFHPRILVSSYDFCNEGIIMKNCMNKQFQLGIIFIYIALSHNNKRINLQYQKGVLQKGFGKHNNKIDYDFFDDAIKLLNEKMLKYSNITWNKEKEYIR